VAKLRTTETGLSNPTTAWMMTAIHSAAKTISQSINPAATRLEKLANAERSSH
jgi:hypothetical protein